MTLNAGDGVGDLLVVFGAGQLLRPAHLEEIQQSVADELSGLPCRTGLQDLLVVAKDELR